MVIDEECSSSAASILRPKGLSKNRGSSSLGKLSPAPEEKQVKLDPPTGFRPDSFLTPPMKDIEGVSSHREVLLVNEDLISKNSADSNDEHQRRNSDSAQAQWSSTQHTTPHSSPPKACYKTLNFDEESKFISRDSSSAEQPLVIEPTHAG